MMIREPLLPARPNPSRVAAAAILALMGLVLGSCGEESVAPSPEPVDPSVLSLAREDWFWSSIPQAIVDAWPTTNRRGGLVWYNPVVSPVRERDLAPNEGSDERRVVLTFEVNPRIAVTPGAEPVLDPDAWVGITQGISAAGADFSLKQSIEIWVNDFQDPEIRNGTTRPRIHIDLGTISEDAQWLADELPNGNRDTEDTNGDGLLDRTDLVFEDTGLDQLESFDEPGYDPVTDPDPNDDDFDFDRDLAEDEPNNPRLFERVNRFELNAHLEDEDVNRDTALQRANNYYEYTIDLSDTLYVATDVCEDFGECGSSGAENGVNGWRLFRIPIEDGLAVGLPSLSVVRHLRLWFSGFPDTKLLQFAFVHIEGPAAPPPSPPPPATDRYDIDFIGRRFFFVVDPVDPLLTGRFLPVGEGGILPPEIDDLQLWRDDRNQQNNGSAVPGFVYLNPIAGEAAEDSLETILDPLSQQADYTIRRDLFTLNDGQNVYPYLIIDLLSSTSRTDILAATFTATYRTNQGPIQIRYGSMAGADTVRAKALYIPEAFYETGPEGFFLRNSYWYPVRRLELRNAYSVGTTGFDPGNLLVRVERLSGGQEHFPGNETATYLRGLGADRLDAVGSPGFDGEIDREFVYPALGLFILPDLRPFAPAAEDSVWPFFRRGLPEFADDPYEIRPAFFVGDDANRAIYDKRSSAPDRTLDRKYLFDISFSRP